MNPTTHELFTQTRELNIEILELLKARIHEGHSDDATKLMEVTAYLRMCEERLEGLVHAQEMRAACAFHSSNENPRKPWEMHGSSFFFD